MRHDVMKIFLVWLPLFWLGTATAQSMNEPPAYCGSDVDNATAGQRVQQLYQLVSGAPYHKRDWDRLHAMHVEGARITPTKHGSDNSFSATPMTVDEFIELNERLFAEVG